MTKKPRHARHNGGPPIEDLPASSNPLEGFQLEDEWAKAAGISVRTCRMYRRRPNGLPYLKWSGLIYIDLAGAQEFIRSLVTRPNPANGKDRPHRAKIAPRKDRSIQATTSMEAAE